MKESLENFRDQIDKIDNKLLNTLAERENIVRKIGEYKKKCNIPPFDEKRWQEVIDSKLSKARSLNISEEFVEKLYGLIHENSLEIEDKSK